jgi:hypothetical protein
MKAELTAISSAGTDECESARSGTQRTDAGAEQTKGASGFDMLATLILRNLKLLLLGPAIAGLVAYGAVSVAPKWYTSVVYLNLDDAGARAADARMQSTPVLDKVLAEFNAPRKTIEARRRYIEENRRIVIAPGETPRTSRLYRMEFSDTDPHAAQKVNSLLVEAWLESTHPAPDKRSSIEAEIERTDAQSKSISKLIERLEKDAPSLIAQSSLQGELATPILGLLTKRDENLANLITLKNSLKGLSRDVVFGSPDLPEEPSWPKRGMITILAAAVTGLLLLLFVILRRFWRTKV